MKKTGLYDHSFKGFCREVWKYRESYQLMLPFTVLFLLFTVIPVVSSMALSFTNFDMLNPPDFVGLENYERLFLDDSIFLIVLKNTLVFAFLTGPISYILSFLFAWLINELGHTMRTFLTLVYYMPVLSGNAYVVWAFLFSSDSYGIINSTFMSLGLIDEPVQWFINQNTLMPTLIVVQLWLSLGTGFLAFIAGFQNVDRSLFEAGAIEGIRSRWQELFHITLPAMSQQLLFTAVMQIGTSFGVCGVIVSLAGFPTTQYSADTIVTYIMELGTTRYEMGYASALAVFLFLLMIGTNALISSALRRFGTD